MAVLVQKQNPQLVRFNPYHEDRAGLPEQDRKDIMTGHIPNGGGCPRKMPKKSDSENPKVPDYLNFHLERWLDIDSGRYFDPPGCYHSYLETPYPIDWRNRRGCIELGIFHYHRFAFYYWTKWKAKKCFESKISLDDFNPPDLISMDWHNDFGCPCDFRDEDIRSINQQSGTEVGLFTWLGLRSLNDGHILPAVMLNLVKNVYLVTKQVKERDVQTITDYFGNEHHVFYLRRLGNFSGIWGKEEMYNPNGIYWDIDLDYFTTMNGEHLKVMSERKIREVFEKYDSEIKMILGRLAGITIALEPEFSGGLASALKLYSIWENIFFTGPISRNSLSDNFTWRKKYLIG